LSTTLFFNKKQKKTEGESCQVGIWQKCFMNEITRSSTRNIGDSWKETSKDEKKRKDKKRLIKKIRKKKL